MEEESEQKLWWDRNLRVSRVAEKEAQGSNHFEAIVEGQNSLQLPLSMPLKS